MTTQKVNLVTRPLNEGDFDQVVNIDATIGGRRRPGFFEKRLHAALVEPKNFIYIGCDYNDNLKGYLLSRLLEGEYGGRKAVAVLDAIGVAPDKQGHGFGRAMLQELESILRHKGISEVQSHADWRNKSILRFFSDIGFRLAPRQILERDVSYMSDMQNELDDEEQQAGNMQNEVLKKQSIICRTLKKEDLPALIEIDGEVMGCERKNYYERKIDEMLDESGIRVSLVAEMDDFVVGFIMARVDYGEFDRTEPVAVLDNIAVDPEFGDYHIGTILLQQLLGNLSTLRLEKIRTEVDAEFFDVLSFLMKNDFKQSQALAFSYSVN